MPRENYGRRPKPRYARKRAWAKRHRERREKFLRIEERALRLEEKKHEYLTS